MDQDDSEGRRGIARRAERRDINFYVESLSRTIQDLRHDEEFKHVFGGVVHTPEQLRLASPKEALTLPADSGARSRFFSRLDFHLFGLHGYGLTSRLDSRPFMTVLKGINQKVPIKH